MSMLRQVRGPWEAHTGLWSSALQQWVPHIQMLGVLSPQLKGNWKEWKENLHPPSLFSYLGNGATVLKKWEGATRLESSNLDYWENQIRWMITPLPVHPSNFKVYRWGETLFPSFCSSNTYPPNSPSFQPSQPASQNLSSLLCKTSDTI